MKIVNDVLDALLVDVQSDNRVSVNRFDMINKVCDTIKKLSDISPKKAVSRINDLRSRLKTLGLEDQAQDLLHLTDVLRDTNVNLNEVQQALIIAVITGNDLEFQVATEDYSSFSDYCEEANALILDCQANAVAFPKNEANKILESLVKLTAKYATVDK